jgi:hypothetical protein
MFCSDSGFQKKKYWPGPGTEENKVVKTAAGIWGLGCEEIIKDVYKVNSRNASRSDMVLMP